MSDYNKTSALQLRHAREASEDAGYCSQTDYYMRKFYGVDSYCPSNENSRQLNRVPRPDHNAGDNYFVSA